MENMARPENIARLTVSHRPTMFTYKDLKYERGPVSAWKTHSQMTYCLHSHLSMAQGFAGDVALHLGLVYRVDRRPHHAAADYNGPERMSLQGIRVKTGIKVQMWAMHGEIIHFEICGMRLLGAIRSLSSVDIHFFLLEVSSECSFRENSS